MTKLKKKTDVNAVKAQVVVAANRFRHGGGPDQDMAMKDLLERMQRAMEVCDLEEIEKIVVGNQK